jgi:hypothetical protein
MIGEPDSSQNSYEREKELRTERIRRDIATRLRRACSYMQEAEFDALVEKILQVHLGSGRRRSH